MKILDIFKKKKESEKPKKKVKKPEIKPKIKEKKAKAKAKAKVFSEAYWILKTPHITEKATDLAKENKYVFKIGPKANKIEIKKAVKDVYGVDVSSVNIINIPSKKRRLGKTQGFKKGYKKAIVKIKKGQKIEVLPQ